MKSLAKLFQSMTVLALFCGAVIFVQSVAAQDDITFGFEVNSIQSASGKRIFSFSSGTGQLTVAADATVDLTVGGTVFDNAAFDFTATKTNSTVLSLVGSQKYSATEFNGTFSFFQQGTGDLILQVNFQDAVLSARNRAKNGALFQSDIEADEEGPAEDLVQFIIGPALAGTQIVPPEGFSFALGSASPKFNTDANGQLKSFNANTSFEADAGVIPEPSALVLAGMGMMGFLGLRRRRHDG